MNKSMRKGMVFFAAAVFVFAAVMVAAGAAMAQSGQVCAYVNDDVYFGGQNENAVDGYLVTTSSQTYLPPVKTGGASTGFSSTQDIVMNPTKSILYAADSYSGDIAAMKIDPAACLLTLLGNYHVGRSNSRNSGIGLDISPNGKWLYVADIGSAKLKLMDIRPDGSLSSAKQIISLTPSPYGINMAVTPNGATLVVGISHIRKHSGINAVLSYSINPSTGFLTSTSSVFTPGQPESVSIDSQSKFVYVNEFDAEALSVGVLEVGSGSTVTFSHEYTFTDVSGSDFLSAAIVSANGKYLYATNPTTANVTTLEINRITGGLKYVTTSSDGIAGSDAPTGLATSKNGTFVFTGNEAPNMGILAARKGGSLTSLGVFPLAQGEEGVSYPSWIVAATF